jgi:hypothetical protein
VACVTLSTEILFTFSIRSLICSRPSTAAAPCDIILVIYIYESFGKQGLSIPPAILKPNPFIPRKMYISSYLQVPLLSDYNKLIAIIRFSIIKFE